jgi:hypothetical protein
MNSGIDTDIRCAELKSMVRVAKPRGLSEIEDKMQLVCKVFAGLLSSSIDGNYREITSSCVKKLCITLTPEKTWPQEFVSTLVRQLAEEMSDRIDWELMPNSGYYVYTLVAERHSSGADFTEGLRISREMAEVLNSIYEVSLPV